MSAENNQNPAVHGGSINHHYYRCCVDWPKHDIRSEGGLVSMFQQSTEIKRCTFVRNVNRVDLKRIEASLGYYPHNPDSPLRMSDDYHVRYFKSKLHGNTVYGFTHSGIEYVFVSE